MTPLGFTASLLGSRWGRSMSHPAKCPEDQVNMIYSQILAEFLRTQAEWRREVAERHADPGSRDTAQGFDRAAAHIEGLGDNHPWIAALVEAHWLTAAGFQPTGEPVTRYLRQYNRYEHVNGEDLLFSLAVFAAGDESAVKR